MTKKIERSEIERVIPVISEGDNSPKKEPLHQYVKWFFTLKKASPEGEREVSEIFETLKEWCNKFTFQLEQGTTETEYIHYQGCFQLKERDRKFPLINKLGWNNIYLAPCKDWFAAINYCSKSESKLAGPWNDKSVFFETPILDKEWQLLLKKELEGPVDYRKIIIYVDYNGGKGKTDFCLNMYDNKLANYIVFGATKDLTCMLNREGVKKNILIDIPRDYNFKNWTFIECMKNGCIFDAKYESGILRFAKPNIVIFSNEDIDTSRLSKDRYDIRHL